MNKKKLHSVNKNKLNRKNCLICLNVLNAYNTYTTLIVINYSLTLIWLFFKYSSAKQYGGFYYTILDIRLI